MNSGRVAGPSPADVRGGVAVMVAARASPTVVITLLLVILALSLRVLLAVRSGLWRDEAVTVWYARLPSVGVLLEFIAQHDSHPPLFYVLLRGGLMIVGDSEAAALALPLVFGTALVPVVAVIGRRMFSSNAGIVAAALVALSPPLALYSAQVRPYSLLPLLCLVAVFSLWQGLTEANRSAWLVYAVTTLAMLWSHHWSWLVLAAEWLIVALVVATRPRMWAPMLRPWLLAQAAIGLGIAPWVPALVHQARHAGHGGDPTDSLDRAARIFAEGTLGILSHAPRGVSSLLLVAVAACVGWQLVRLAKASVPPPDAVALLVLLGVPLGAFLAALALQSHTKLFFPRTVAIVAPCLLVALAWAVAGLGSERRRWLPAGLAAALAAAWLAATAVHLSTVKSNARELAAEVDRRAGPTDLVVISPEWLATSFNYYFRGANAQLNFPHDGRRDTTLFDDAPARMADSAALARAIMRLESARRGAHRVWFVMDRDDVFDLPERYPVPTHPTHAGVTARIRTNQLRQHLVRLYGPSRMVLTPRGGREGPEILTAFLFDPGP